MWDELDDDLDIIENDAEPLHLDGADFGDEEDTVDSNHSYGDMFSSETSGDEAVSYTVLQAYTPVRVGELALAVGDRVKVTDDSDDVWWVGKTNKLSGRFPAKNVGASI